MARRRFKNYSRKNRQPRPRRYGRKNNSKKYMILAIIVIIAGVLIIKKVRSKDGEVAVNQNDAGISINITDDGTPKPTPTPEPETGTTPTPGPETTVLDPDPEPDPPIVKDAPPVIEDTGTTSSEAIQLMREANDDLTAGRIIATRNKLNDVLEMQLSSSDRQRIKAQMAKLAEKWLFSKEIFTEDRLTDVYHVQTGDNLEAIGREYKVPYQIIMDINNIANARSLRAGKPIKVINGPFNVVIYHSTFTMDLYLKDVYVKSYKVGLGVPEHETPLGEWIVRPGNKFDNKPTWTDPDTGKTYIGSDPDYPLGERWIGIEGLDDNTKDRTGFAIHGTKDPDSIGKRSSRGCIRLYNGDVIEAYNMLAERHSQVSIRK